MTETLTKQTLTYGVQQEFSVVDGILPSEPLQQSLQLIPANMETKHFEQLWQIELSEFEKDVLTYMQLESELMKDPKYHGKYVVIREGKIVASGEDKKKLLLGAYSKYGYVPLLVHKVGERRAIRIYSPRRRQT